MRLNLAEMRWLGRVMSSARRKIAQVIVFCIESEVALLKTIPMKN